MRKTREMSETLVPVTDPTPQRLTPPQRLVHDVALPRNTARSPTIYARGGWLLGLLYSSAAVVVPLAAVGRSKYRPRASDATS